MKGYSLGDTLISKADGSKHLIMRFDDDVACVKDLVTHDDTGYFVDDLELFFDNKGWDI